MIEPDQLMGSKRIYEGRIINMRVDTIRLPDGRTASREVIEHRGAVAIVPLIDRQTVVMVKQYRSAAGKVLLEIPAGTREAGENLETCARRELAEETNFQATHLIKLFQSYVAPGYSSELIHVYLAHGLSHAAGKLDEDEFVEVERVRLANVPDMIARGEIEDGKSIGGLYAALQVLPTLQW
jgi:ADP-ribose pyrophosphatase